MTRLCSFMMFVVCMSLSICIGNANGQDAFIDVGDATIKGEVVDISPEMKPIAGVTVKIVNVADGQEYIVTTDENGYYEKTGLPAGRYTISVSKKGYGIRQHKSKVVAAGGEIFDRIKMRKNEYIHTYLLKQLFTWPLLVGFAIGFLLGFFIDSRRSRV